LTGSYKIAPDPSGSSYTKETCNDLCKQTTDCANFYLGKADREGRCGLYRKGCGITSSSNWDFYEVFDATEMSNCKMYKNILVTTNTDKITCQNDICDVRVIDGS